MELNYTFNYFKHKYPGKVKFRDLTPDELAAVKEHFPEDLYDFLKEEGYCSYGEGFFHFVDPKAYAGIRVEKGIPDGHLIFFRTAMGDLFTWNGDAVFISYAAINRFSQLSDDLFDFFKFSLGDKQFIDETLSKKRYDAAKNRLGEPLQDEFYAAIESGKGEKLEKASIFAHFAPNYSTE